ncbi:hypothetical protein E1100_26410 [Vibrio owensii]|uniref:hypothetical protein n=1 Tax=Vibrio owensii TaxID=696485 RepID=UPI0010505A6B|nr:hypothetical protein [Vibrio owensii]TDE19110.1 hypothetical protein E1100_26410 [Vibrio owensii]
MQEVPYASELFSATLGCLLSLVAAFLVFKRQVKLESEKKRFDVLAIEVIKYIDNLCVALAKMRNASDETYAERKREVHEVMMYHQVISCRLHIIDNKELVEDFGEYIEYCIKWLEPSDNSQYQSNDVNELGRLSSKVVAHLLVLKA